MPAILCIGDPGHTLANTDFVGQKIVVGKAKEGEGGRLVYLGEDRIVTVPVPHIAKAFDVRPNLLQRWGFIREANALLDVQEGVETNSFKLDQERAG